MSYAVLPVVMPLLAAFFLPRLGRERFDDAFWSGRIVLVLVAWLLTLLWGDVSAGGPISIAVGGFAAPYGIEFRIDHFSLLFAGALVLPLLLLWPVGRDDPARQAALLLLLTGAGCGLAFSADLFNLYVFYELTAVASYGLATGGRSGPGYVAAFRYLLLSGIGSSLALLGIALLYSVTGTLNLAHLAEIGPDLLGGPLGLSAFLLMLFGFGVKAELFPINSWVPEVYRFAPARISALLAGSVSKLALLVLLHLLLQPYLGTKAPLLLALFGLLSLISGEFAAYRARNLRQMLAYSSIGQLGLVALAFSVPDGLGVAAGIALALHHLLVKSGLFLLAEQWGDRLDRLTGLARRSPLAGVIFVLLALSLIGAPPLPGFWAKLLLFQALFGAGHGIYSVAAAAVAILTVVEAAYLFRLARRLYGEDERRTPAPAFDPIMPGLFAGVLLLVTLLPGPTGEMLRGAAAQITPTVVHGEGEVRAAALPPVSSPRLAASASSTAGVVQ